MHWRKYGPGHAALGAIGRHGARPKLGPAVFGTVIAIAAIAALPILAGNTPAPSGAPGWLLSARRGLQPPVAALQADGAAGDGQRSLGLAPATPPNASPQIAADAPGAGAALPASVDLSQYSPPVASQGVLASCVSWVTGYYLRGWYARRDGYYPTGGPDGNGGFAPMYLFNQITQGQDKGTTFNANLDMMQAQGIDTRADYTQGDTDYADAPTPAERANAASYKIAGYSILFTGPNQGPSAQQAIEASLASGNPVSIGLPVYDSFWNADATHYYVDVPGPTSMDHGNHAVFASKYDANGLWVENQWGTGWGLNGWVELSWAFVNQYVWEAVTVRPAAPPAGSAPSIAATPSPVAAASATAVATSTSPSTATPAVSATATPVAVTAAPSEGNGDPGGHGSTTTRATRRHASHARARRHLRRPKKRRAHTAVAGRYPALPGLQARRPGVRVPLFDLITILHG